MRQNKKKQLKKQKKVEKDHQKQWCQLARETTKEIKEELLLKKNLNLDQNLKESTLISHQQRGLKDRLSTEVYRPVKNLKVKIVIKRITKTFLLKK